MTISTDPRAEALDRLPVREAVPELLRALDDRGVAVLCAPPGTGKTTLVPLVLAGLVGGGPVRRVLVAEPRRIAARAAARRMAWLLGERPGGKVGFTVRGERQAGRGTVVEVVTTGVLLQRLQRDQELAGVDVVVLDECHERHLDADTAAAFLLDVRAALRPDLWLIATSATTDAEGWARLLGDGGTDGSGSECGDGRPGKPAPVVSAPGVSHPVEVVWAPPERPVRPPHGMRVDPALLDHVAAVVRRALREREGDVLCFLPGVGEIARVAGKLGGLDGTEVLQVHGRAPAAVQEAVLSGADGGRRRVVLATSVAESSLTVPGVRIVVDCGLAREPRMDHARGLSALTTVRASRAAARQRAGRAGREAPGVVYRCWPEAEDARLPRFPSPEIAGADLTAFALQTACWGDPDASGLALLDPPPAGAMTAARETLTAIGAVDTAGRATERGTRMARLGLHPRLARALVDGAKEVGARRAAEVVALLSEEPPREYGDDLTAAWRTARHGGDPYATRWRQEARRLERALTPEASARPDSARGGDGPGRGEDGSARGGGGPGRGGDLRGGDGPGRGGDGLGRGGDLRGGDGPARGEDCLGRGENGPARGGGGPGRSGDLRGGDGPARRGDGPRRGEDGPARGGDGPGRGGDDPAHSGGGPARRGDGPGRGSDLRGDGPAHGSGGPSRGGDGPGRGGDPRGGGGPARRGDGPRGGDNLPTRGSDLRGGDGPARGGDGPHDGDNGPARGGGPHGGDSLPARGSGGPHGDDAVAGLMAALAFPERVARRRGERAYLMAAGTGAELADGSRLGGAPWLAVAVADRPVAAASARVRLAAVTDEGTARAAAAALASEGEEVRWADGDVLAHQVARLGAIELVSRPLTDPDPEQVRRALLEGLRREGTGLLRWSAQATAVRQRMAFLHRELGGAWPDVSDAALLDRADEWLGSELARARGRADLGRVDAGQALARLLPWATGEAARFEELAPERIEVPSGSRVRLDYGADRPVLAVKLQELFGWQEAPRIAGGRVPLLVHLLSPAGRPAAVTADLASFWKDGYRSVRAELRGRYPKHPWPEDPTTAEPTRRTNTRRGR
ncbi:ATP-dependent helicase C-terminal domain-containing protein [Streptomyces malaysiensis]|uniref:Helicase-related protein n=1 Tax=Streptomyces malaysiensis subsp. samsunensis TaxID=459658 RepID=A0A9X2M3U9_STRMQ|nr:ATP-dependent helicase C-terminal domain-containing protein [Streptomyces samsunensis]MCQ8834518.1 helicase-related protein [Streptomyces samsunensis]